MRFRFKHFICIFSEGGADKDNADSNNIILAVKLCASVVALSAKDSQKLPKRLSKEFEKLAYWNEYKIKVRVKIGQLGIDVFLNQTL